MNIGDFSNSCCRHCQHYQIEGRRGGHCTLLSVPVRSEWSACSLGVPAFAPAKAAVANMAEAKMAEAKMAEAKMAEAKMAEVNMAEVKVTQAIAFKNSQLDLAKSEKNLNNRILTTA